MPRNAPQHRMRRRPPAEPRIGAEVRQALRRRVGQHHAEHAVLARQRADRVPLLVADAVDHELGESALVVRHAERGVVGVEQAPRRTHDGLQDVADRAVRRDREHGGAEFVERAGAESTPFHAIRLAPPVTRMRRGA